MDDCNLDNVEAETSFEIQLYIYDLSRGLAQSLLSQILGKQIPGIWHTSIVAYNREIFFGGAGIESCDPVCENSSYFDFAVKINLIDLLILHLDISISKISKREPQF